MSRIPDDLKSKHNHDKKYLWIDAQLEKFMERQKEDAEYIENLEGGISEMEKRMKELEDELSEIKQDVFNLPNNFKLGSKIRQRFNKD